MGPGTTTSITVHSDGTTRLPPQAVASRNAQSAQPVEMPAQQHPQQTAESLESLRQAVHKGNEALGKVSTGVEFNLDDDTGRVIVRVVDTETREILRQIPSEEMLAIARAIGKLQGLLIEQEA